MSVPRRLLRLPVAFAVWRLPPDAAWPAAAHTARWAFVARTPDEVSLILPAGGPAPSGARQAPGLWHGWRVAGVLDFAWVGLLAELSAVLAQAGIPLLAVSTFDTDYIFVRAEQRAAAEAAWRAAGWEVAAPDAAA